MDFEIEEVQANYLNYTYSKFSNLVHSEHIESKLGFLICSGNKVVIEGIKNIEIIEKTIDRQIQTGNNRRALIFICLLKKKVVDLVNYVEKINITF